MPDRTLEEKKAIIKIPVYDDFEWYRRFITRYLNSSEASRTSKTKIFDCILAEESAEELRRRSGFNCEIEKDEVRRESQVGALETSVKTGFFTDFPSSDRCELNNLENEVIHSEETLQPDDFPGGIKSLAANIVDGSIEVEWSGIKSASNYCVCVYTNGQRNHEATTTEPRFHIEYPNYSTVYHFDVWVQNQLELTIASSNEVTTEACEWIPAAKSKAFKISSSGGIIDMGDCVITFPENAFGSGSEDHETDVEVTLEVDSSKWPEGYICISPMLHVDCSEKLQKDVSVTLSSWCFNDYPDEEEEDEVCLLHLADGGTEWDVLDKLPLPDVPCFEFTCKDFSKNILGKKKVQGKQLICVFLFQQQHNGFTVAFCIDSQTLKVELAKAHAKSGYGQVIRFDTITAKRDDTVELRTKLTPAHFKFSHRFAIVIDQDFIKFKKKSEFTSYLKAGEEWSGYVEVECQLCLNDEVVDCNHAFQHPWTPTPMHSAVPPQTVIVQGDMIQDSSQHLNANTIVTNGSKMTSTATGCTSYCGR